MLKHYVLKSSILSCSQFFQGRFILRLKRGEVYDICIIKEYDQCVFMQSCAKIRVSGCNDTAMS